MKVAEKPKSTEKSGREQSAGTLPAEQHGAERSRSNTAPQDTGYDGRDQSENDINRDAPSPGDETLGYVRELRGH